MTLVVACLRGEVVAGEADRHVPEFERSLEEGPVTVVDGVEGPAQRDFHTPGIGGVGFSGIDFLNLCDGLPRGTSSDR
ncbi:hypothetical protein ACFQH8_14395 [Halomicroarcula sp. GCM10025710]